MVNGTISAQRRRLSERQAELKEDTRQSITRPSEFRRRLGPGSGGRDSIPSPTSQEVAARASLVKTEVVPEPTPAEVQAKASLIKRTPVKITRPTTVVTSERPTPGVIRGVGGFLGISTPETTKTRRVIVPRGAASPIDVFIKSSGEAVFGKQEPGKPTIAGRGGAAQRGLASFRGGIKGGEEFGFAVAGPVGGVVGLAGGGALGFVGGAFEIGVSTPVRALGGFIQAPGGGGRIFGGAAPIAGQTFELAGEVVGAGALIKSSPRLAGRAAALTATGREFNIGFNLARTGAPGFRALTGGEAAGRKAAEVVRVAKPVIQNPFLNIPGRTALAFTLVDISQAGKRVTAPPGFTEFTQTQMGAAQIQAGFGRIEQSRAEKGFIPQVGFGLGLSGLSERFEELGGISAKEAEKQFRAAGVPEEFVKQASVEFKARQLGSLGGQVVLGSVTETLGRFSIGRTVTKGLAGQVTGVTAKGVTKRAALITGKTIPAFALLGAGEGVGGFAISELGAGRIQRAGDIPKAISERPLEFGLAGVFGSVSAITLGATPVFFATKRALGKGGFGTKAAEKGILTTGFILDPTEKPGDVLASLFGVPEPSFRVRTVSGVSTLVPVTQQAPRDRGVTVPAPSQVGVSVAVGIPQPIQQAIPGVPDPVPILQNIFLGTPITVPIKQVPTPIPIQPPVPLQQAISISTPVPIPITFGIPIVIPESRAPFPLLLPPGRLGGRGRGKGKRAPLGFIDELALVFGGTIGSGRLSALPRGRPKRIPTVRRKEALKNFKFSAFNILNIPKKQRSFQIF